MPREVFWYFSPSGGVPEPICTIKTRTRDPLTVRGKSHAVHTARMTFECQHSPALLRGPRGYRIGRHLGGLRFNPFGCLHRLNRLRCFFSRIGSCFRRFSRWSFRINRRLLRNRVLRNRLHRCRRRVDRRSVHPPITSRKRNKRKHRADHNNCRPINAFPSRDSFGSNLRRTLKRTRTTCLRGLYNDRRHRTCVKGIVVFVKALVIAFLNRYIVGGFFARIQQHDLSLSQLVKDLVGGISIESAGVLLDVPNLAV